MSLPFLLREAKTYEQRYALVKAVYDIRPSFGELAKLGDFMVGEKDFIIYGEVQEMLKKFGQNQVNAEVIHPATLTPTKSTTTPIVAVAVAKAPIPIQVKKPMVMKSANPIESPNQVPVLTKLDITPWTKAEDLPPLTDEMSLFIKNQLNMNVKYIESKPQARANLYEICQGCPPGKVKNLKTGNCVLMTGQTGKTIIHEAISSGL